jgi:broad specificity phosphatase PhoE
MTSGSGTMRVGLLRHPEVEGARVICYGRSDRPLQDAARDFGAASASVPSARRVVSSPSARCRALAEHLARRDALTVELEADLLELDFGRWEGVPWDDVPRTELDAWAADPWGYAPGGGESVTALWQRIGSCRERLASQAARGDSKPTVAPAAASLDLLIVAHQGPLRVWLTQALELPRERVFDLRVEPGAAGLRVLVRERGRWSERGACGQSTLRFE